MAHSLEQAPLPFYEQNLPQLDRYQRIEVLSVDPEGFLPPTKAEQVEVMGLQSVIHKSYGVSKHLAEVRIGQGKTKMADPEATARRIVRDYVGWALDAHQTQAQLGVLEEELKYVNPELPLGNNDLQKDVGRIGLLKFMRFFDLAVLRDSGRVDKVGYDPQRITYTEENPGILAHLEMAQDSWRVGQVKRALPLAQQDTTNRFMFWVPRLVEITKHSPKSLKAIAHEGIDKIYDRQKV